MHSRSEWQFPLFEAHSSLSTEQNTTEDRYYQVTYMKNHTPKASAPNARQKGSLGLNVNLTLSLTQTRIPTLSLAKPLQPVAPSLVHPVEQSLQTYPPSVFVQLRLAWQPPFPDKHSFTSTEQNKKSISLSSYLHEVSHTENFRPDARHKGPKC